MFGEIGVSTWACVGMPIGRSLKLIEEAGFGSIEIWGDEPSHFNLESRDDVLQLRDDLSTSGLRPDSLHAPFGKQMDISNPNPTIRKGVVKNMLRHLDSASKLSVNAIVIHPGHIMKRDEGPKRYEMATKSLEEICAAAHDLGIEVCVENLLSKPEIFVFCDTLPKVLHLIRSIEGFAPGICIDTSHANVMGSVAEDIEICGEVIHRTHLSDNFGVNDDHLPPGDGEIDWKSVFTSLRRISYSGPLILEVAGRDNPAEVLSRSRSALMKILSG